ncbi:MAG: hypothetical protein L0216_19550 [Planctomycetales bacterium]|nr:hypothetical protein [Planctomycetales bacterium]
MRSRAGSRALLAVLLAGCAAPPARTRPIPAGDWAFDAPGPHAAENALWIRVRYPRDGAQRATVRGIVGGARILRIRPLGERTDGESNLLPLGNEPAAVAWEVEGRTPEGQPVSARVEARLPRLPLPPPGADPNDPLAEVRLDLLDLEAAGTVTIGRTRVPIRGAAPVEEPLPGDDEPPAIPEEPPPDPTAPPGKPARPPAPGANRPRS